MPKYFLLLSIFLPFCATAKIWTVGKSGTFDFSTISAAAVAVSDGDTIYIDGGSNYDGEVGRWSNNNLLIQGVNGRPHFYANNAYYDGKGTWVISGNNITVVNIEFSGASVPDRNGAGIRLEPALNLTIIGCHFHNNENGILTAGQGGKLVVEESEFAYNGYGDGLSHNIYIGSADTAILRFNYFHHAKIGHEVKSRARVNYILYNRISNETNGDASRNIDLPNGGVSVILGNIIQQSPVSGNGNIVGYGLEGLSNSAPHRLYVINNTFVNNRPGGSFLHAITNTGLIKIYNNIFAGPGMVLNYDGNSGNIDSVSNIVQSSIAAMGFADPDNYDYRITTGLGADVGSDPGIVPPLSLIPVFEYVHPVKYRIRPTNNAIDIGAFEISQALPLKSIDLSTTLKGNGVSVLWHTSDEVNISRFELQRSADGVLFEMIVSIPAKNMLSNNYSYLDPAPYQQKTYYRVKVVEMDGQSYFSPVTFLRTNKLSVPRVAFSGRTLQITGIPESFSGKTILKIFNYSGQIQVSQSVDVPASGTVTIPEMKPFRQPAILILYKDQQQLLIPFATGG